MKNLSRLTALLLALVMLLSITASATELSNYTKSDYDQDIQALIDDFPNLPVEQQYSLLMSMGEDTDQITMLVEKLDSDQRDNLLAYIALQVDYSAFETKSYTKAGPFMDPVEISQPMARMLMRSAVVDTSDPLQMSKSVTPNEDGSYKIRLETYTTGTVTTTSTTVPVDIVLVLDQSGSMAYNFGDTTRQKAMQTAVKNFITNVGAKYDAETSNHRIAIVTFANKGSAKVRNTFTSVDEAGIKSLTESIGELGTPSGGTYIDEGVDNAYNLFAADTLTGTRNRVVIVFTDGMPGTGDWATVIFGNDSKVADDTIATCKKLKAERTDSNKGGGATVYTIGIFEGATMETVPEYEDVWALDDEEKKIRQTNRFLHLASSNYPEASNRKTSGTQNSNGLGYYLTAANQSKLNEIFTTINSQISSTNKSLGTESVIKDVVMPQFEIKDTVSDIELYTAEYDGTDFGSDTKLSADSGVTASIENNTVSVTGFAFDDNYVTTEPRDGFYGKKLIIVFDVEPTEQFLGGNAVWTNGAKSGLYAEDGTEAGLFNRPTVDVPVKPIKPKVVNQNIYLTNAVDLTDLCGEFDPRIDGTNNAYVKVKYEIMDGEKVIATCEVAPGKTHGPWTTADGQNSLPVLYEDKDYTVKCTVDGTNDGNQNVVYDDANATVNVFTPVLTFNDSEIDYLSIIADHDYVTDNLVSKRVVTEGEGETAVTKTVVAPDCWIHGDKENTDVTMQGNEPELTLTYTPASGISEDGKVTATNFVPVNVTVKRKTDVIGGDITGYTTFIRQACSFSDCANKNQTQHVGSEEKPEFLLHVINVVADLTITKTDLDKYAYSGEGDRESAIFKVVATDKNGEQTYWISLANGQSVTIKDLLVGTPYTITEQNDWTWRYKNQEDSQGTITRDANGNGVKVTIKNEATNPYWLGGDNYKVNVFGTN